MFYLILMFVINNFNLFHFAEHGRGRIKICLPQIIHFSLMFKNTIMLKIKSIRRPYYLYRRTYRKRYV